MALGKAAICLKALENLLSFGLYNRPESGILELEKKRALAEIEDNMTRMGVPHVSVRPENPDYLMLAKAFNCHAHHAESIEDFKNALTQAFSADRPTLIEVRQDSAFLP